MKGIEGRHRERKALEANRTPDHQHQGGQQPLGDKWTQREVRAAAPDGFGDFFFQMNQQSQQTQCQFCARRNSRGMPRSKCSSFEGLCNDHLSRYNTSVLASCIVQCNLRAFLFSSPFLDVQHAIRHAPKRRIG